MAPSKDTDAKLAKAKAESEREKEPDTRPPETLDAIMDRIEADEVGWPTEVAWIWPGDDEPTVYEITTVDEIIEYYQVSMLMESAATLNHSAVVQLIEALFTYDALADFKADLGSWRDERRQAGDSLNLDECFTMVVEAILPVLETELGKRGGSRSRGLRRTGRRSKSKR